MAFLLEELENMASTAMAMPSEDEVSVDAQVQRFQKLFQYSPDEALEVIKRRRGDISRKTVADAHWELVREEKEGEGYDREAYEYALEVGSNGRQDKVDRVQPTSPGSRTTYLMKLEGSLDCPLKVQHLTGAMELPRVMRGTGDSGDADFCVVNGVAKAEILSALSQATFKPTFVRLNMATKKLSGCSPAPTLGFEFEPTLPQHRVDEANHVFYPAQDQYPVLYFFYGTLAEPAVLSNKLELSESPVLRPATVQGGVLRTWGAKYRALVDGPVTAKVNGWVYDVASREHEEQLQLYETDQYEVVRCDIVLQDREMTKGLTFRFIGEIDGDH